MAIITGRVITRDVYDGGGYRIYGYGRRQGVLARKRFRLFLRRSGRLIREVWSDPVTGYYEFGYIAYIYRGYTVVEYDDDTEATLLNAAIADFVTPELIQ